MAAKKELEKLVLNVSKINLKTIIVTVEGTSSLIMHCWSEKAKKEILDQQRKVDTNIKVKREPRNPVRDFIESMYWITPMPTEFTEEAFDKAVASGARFSFPAIAFKLAAVSAGYRAKLTKDKVSILGTFRVSGVGEFEGVNEFVEIKSTPVMREDMVRLQGTSSDLRYRGEFPNWTTEIKITYNADVINATELVNLLNFGGFSCGVGEWRPEKSGQFGMYEIKEGK